MELEMITVRVAGPERNQVALWERHPAHPDGEVFLCGEGEFRVAATPAVEARLRNGRLVAVEPAVAPAFAPAVGTVEPEAAASETDVPARPKRAPKGKGGL